MSQYLSTPLSNIPFSDNVLKSSSCKRGKHAWEVFAEYWFSCPEKGRSCYRPATTNIKIYVKANKPYWRTLRVSSIPKDRETNYWVNIFIRENKNSAYNNEQCNSVGSYQKGFLENGKPICECLPTHEEVGRNGVTGQPVCAPRKCEDGGDDSMTKIGVDQNGKTICVPKKFQVKCDAPVEINGDDSNCGPNGWIADFKIGDCKIVSIGGGGSKKGGGGSVTKEIDCANDQMVCCRWKK